MLIQHLDQLASSLFSLLAIASLLLSFVMLGSRWLKNYLYAFAAELWIIAALSATVGYYGDYPELYLIAILTSALPRPAPAVPDLADYSQARSRSGNSRHSSTEHEPRRRRLLRHVRPVGIVQGGD